MKYCFVIMLVTLTACSGSSKNAGGLSSISPCTALPGSYCDTSGNLKPLQAGYCASNSDCAAGYTCNTATNLCAQNVATGTQIIWFATDPIRPGVTKNSSQSNDYIYNIMARGHQSLDDWCMSQAQQSNVTSVRQVASWTALISSADSTNKNQQRFNEFFAWQTYRGPKGQLPLTNIPAAGTSWVPVFDKNSNPLNFGELLWSGFGQNGLSPSCVNQGTPWASSLGSYTTTCGFYNVTGYNSGRIFQGLQCVDSNFQRGSWQCNCTDNCGPPIGCPTCNTCYDFSGIPQNNCNNSFRIMCLSAVDS